MISTNLSTRPFYNERLAHAVLLVITLLVLVVAALNVWTIVTLSRIDAQQNAQAARAEQKTTSARQAASRILQSIDAAQLSAVAGEADEANRLIDARTFSWTRLLTDFEQTLPEDVRITMVSPKVDKEGRMFIDIAVVGRRAEDVNDFVEKLEAHGDFVDLVPRQEQLNQEGLREVMLSGRYVGAAGRATP